MLENCKVFPATIQASIKSQDSLGLLPTRALPELIKHGVVCYLFINPLFEVSQHTARAVVETAEGFAASEQPRSFLHAITIRPIWPCEDAPVCSHGGCGCAS